MSYNKATGMYEGYIYLITNKVNNKKYVGQTQKTIKRRFNDHLSEARNNRGFTLHDAIRKYGEECFCIEEIEKVETNTLNQLVNLLDEKEIYWISYYDTYHGEGYNTASGGSFGRSLCEEKWIPVDVYDINGNLLYQFDNYEIASENIGVTSSMICSCCKGKSKTCNGYVIRYRNDPFNKYPIKDNRNYFVYQFSENRELIHIYDSLKETSEITGYPYDNLRAAIKYKRLYNGFYWSKTDDITEHINKEKYDNRIKIDKYSLMGKFIGTYDSIVDGGKSIGKGKDTIQGILKCCRGERIYAYNYIWRFHGEPFDKYNTIIDKTNVKPFNLYNIDNVYIGTYEKQICLKDIPDIKLSTFKEKMSHGIHIIENYKWYYIQDENQPDKTKIKSLNQFLSELEENSLNKIK